MSSDVAGVEIRVGEGIRVQGIVQLEGGGLPPSFSSLARSLVFADAQTQAGPGLRTHRDLCWIAHRSADSLELARALGVAS